MRRLRRSFRYVAIAASVLAVIARSAVQTVRQRRGRAPNEARQEQVAASAEIVSEPPVPEQHAATDPDFHLPAPSIWPVSLALGITLLLFGVVTDFLLSALGGLFIVGSLGGWIGELRHE